VKGRWGEQGGEAENQVKREGREETCYHQSQKGGGGSCKRKRGRKKARNGMHRRHYRS